MDIASYKNDAFDALCKCIKRGDEWAIKYVLETAHSIQSQASKNTDLLMQKEEPESSGS
jgi:hypothetical protein